MVTKPQNVLEEISSELATLGTGWENYGPWGHSVRPAGQPRVHK